jgi:hypothetical protein
MDQGLAAVVAGVAGFVGATIGGGGAVWGSWIGGKKAIEAAERQAQRTAAAEQQQWQRQARHDAYEAVAAIARSMANWGEGEVPWEVARDAVDRLSAAVGRVELFGPEEAVLAAGEITRLVGAAVVDSWSLDDIMTPWPPHPGQPVPVAGYPPLVWRNRNNEFASAREGFGETIRQVLSAPPT